MTRQIGNLVYDGGRTFGPVAQKSPAGTVWQGFKEGFRFRTQAQARRRRQELPFVPDTFAAMSAAIKERLPLFVSGSLA